MVIVLLSAVPGFAQIKNVKTESVKIYGNCDKCKKTIETAGNLNRVAKVEWNKDTKMATLNYDSGQTSSDEILKRIALAGYDSDKFLAPDDVYAKLPGCCQYDRALKTAVAPKHEGMAMKTGHSEHNMDEMKPAKTTTHQNASQLKIVFEHYFSIKNALVKSDAQTAASKAAALVVTAKGIEMDKLNTAEHNAWMKEMKGLMSAAASISKSKDVAKQRGAFALLSQNVYELAKVSKQDTPVYYQHCPMFNKGSGAYWLSKESEVKNPYYGAQMISCGSTKETLK